MALFAMSVKRPAVAILLSSLFACAPARAGLLQTLGPRTPGDVYGNSVVGGYNGFAFLFNDVTQVLTTLPVSGAAHGISGNLVVGSWGNAGWMYSLSSSAYTTLNNPLGVNGTRPNGIDGDNVVGSYVDAAGKQHGFLYNLSTEAWTKLDFPGAVTLTSANDIWGNIIVGQYINASGSHGFIYDGSTWTSLTAPSGNGYTSITGIWGNKLVGIFGAYTLYDLSTHAYSNPLAGVQFPPGQLVQSVTLNGISGNTVVGTYHYFNGSFFADSGFVYIGIPEVGAIVLTGIGMAGLALLLGRRVDRQPSRSDRRL